MSPKIEGMLKKKRAAVGHQIAVFALGSVVFAFLWAVVDYAVFVYLQQFQLAWFPSGVFDPNELLFMGQLIFWFPFFVMWSLAFNLWNGAQRRMGPEDFST